MYTEITPEPLHCLFNMEIYSDLQEWQHCHVTVSFPIKMGGYDKVLRFETQNVAEKKQLCCTITADDVHYILYHAWFKMGILGQTTK